MKIIFNSPVVLTYALICCGIMILTQTIFPAFNYQYFALPANASFSNPGDWFKMISHIAGHQNWPHLVGNFSIILLIGPILEEKFGAFSLLVAILVTGLLTGFINTLFFSDGLLGASGIAFMMIVLTSMMDLKNKQIPVTFILVALLYLGSEIYTGVTNKTDHISHFAHIFGGVCGLGFGFGMRRK